MKRPIPVQTQRFTLVEIVVVMVIILVMLGLSMASYRSVARANMAESAARELGSTLSYARQLAVTRREFVAVIMPGHSGTGLDPEYQYRTYRLAFVDSSYDFLRWVDDSAWTIMRSGVSIMEADDDIGIQDSTSYIKNPDDNSTTQIDDVNLAERLNGGGSAANVRAVVFSPSGQLKGSSRFITVGRATYDGSNWTIHDPGSASPNYSATDQMTLEVNRFTGSVRYLMPAEYPP